MSEYHKSMRTRRKAEGLCTSCGKYPAVDGRVSCAQCLEIHKLKAKIATPKYKSMTKDAAFSAYGGYKCSCLGCPETNVKFMTLDFDREASGAGHKHITGSGEHLYLWLKKNRYPNGFKVLCFNCNSGRYINGGTCPHMEDQ